MVVELRQQKQAPTQQSKYWVTGARSKGGISYAHKVLKLLKKMAWQIGSNMTPSYQFQQLRGGDPMSSGMKKPGRQSFARITLEQPPRLS
ncbi:MAG: hypothetical protein CMB79_07955 [Filomicrobium sp.]|nr:hypothetical protein [Filomicrobium sp.]